MTRKITQEVTLKTRETGFRNRKLHQKQNLWWKNSPKKIPLISSLLLQAKTSRERPKSVLYLRLKIVKGGTPRALWNSSWLQNMKKNWGEPFGDLKKFPKKIIEMRFLNSHSAEKCKRGDPLGFFDIHCVAKRQKNEGGPFSAIQKGILSVNSSFWTSVLFLLFVLDALLRLELLRFEVVEVWRCWTN